jgi:hypothetical protein
LRHLVANGEAWRHGSVHDRLKKNFSRHVVWIETRTNCRNGLLQPQAPHDDLRVLIFRRPCQKLLEAPHKGIAGADYGLSLIVVVAGTDRAASLTSVLRPGTFLT